jgi:hypothetical protein
MLRRAGSHTTNLLPVEALDDRKREHGVAGSSVGVLLAEVLEDFLHDREAGHDVVEVYGCLQIQGATRPEGLRSR